MKRVTKKKKPVSEFKDKVLEISRVSRVVAGGKRFRFRAVVVVGDMKGRVGVGVDKGSDVASAVEKAKRDAEKHVVEVVLREKRTIPYDVEAKYGASRVRLKPAREGHGLIAGGACRAVLELAGVRDISAKIMGRTTNKLTNARATVRALQKIRLPKEEKPTAVKEEEPEKSQKLEMEKTKENLN